MLFLISRRNGISRRSMMGRTILVAVVSVFTLLSVIQVANARDSVSGKIISEFNLSLLCAADGGVFFPAGTGGAYACLLPDGTYIVCGGIVPFCTETRTLEDKGLGLLPEQAQRLKALVLEYEKFRIRAEADVDLAEVDVEALAEDDKSDMRAVENALKKSEAARTAMRQGGIKTRRAVSAVLTPEQRDKWRSLMEMRLVAKAEAGNAPGARGVAPLGFWMCWTECREYPNR
jgi:Spy/CpxP family protein refolding chaperone